MKTGERALGRKRSRRKASNGHCQRGEQRGDRQTQSTVGEGRLGRHEVLCERWNNGSGTGGEGKRVWSAQWFASEINDCFNKMSLMAHWYLGNCVVCFWWKVRCKYLGEKKNIEGTREQREAYRRKKPFERIKDETQNRVHGAGLERDSRINLKPTTAAFSSAAVQHEVRQHKFNSNRRQMVLGVCRHREKLDVIHYSQVKQAFSYQLNKLLQHLHRNGGLER